jgi:hypothetical protein
MRPIYFDVGWLGGFKPVYRGGASSNPTEQLTAVGLTVRSEHEGEAEGQPIGSVSQASPWQMGSPSRVAAGKAVPNAIEIREYQNKGKEQGES